jgi:non-homologous end joining protein Ku
LISELSGTEFQPEVYEDGYRKRLLKGIEQKVAGEEIQGVEVEARPTAAHLQKPPDPTYRATSAV